MFGYQKSVLHSLRVVVLGLAAALCPVVSSAAPAPETLLAQGRVDDAISSLETKLNNAPDDAQSYNLLCRAYFVVDNWEAAGKACEKAVFLQPSSSDFHLWLGRVYGEKADHTNFISAAGMAKKVRNEFETAVRLNPANLEARADLAQFYVEAPGIIGGGKDKAEGQAREIANLDPAQGELVEAWIAEKNKNLGSAEGHFRSAVQLSHGKPGAWLNLAQFYRRTGRMDKMQDAVEHAISANDSHRVLMQAADILNRTKRNIPRAVELLRQYLSSPTAEDAPAFKAHYLLGTIYEQQGNTTAAAEEYRSALALAKGYTLAQSALDRVTRETASGPTQANWHPSASE
ncbi:MAG TPA: tetratricopeptide repeat protein [Terriglobales bacterium]|nr:tetratricopeptide repeat protein [Terriglobales bacterium]